MAFWPEDRRTGSERSTRSSTQNYESKCSLEPTPQLSVTRSSVIGDSGSVYTKSTYSQNLFGYHWKRSVGVLSKKTQSSPPSSISSKSESPRPSWRLAQHVGEPSGPGAA